MEIQSYSEDFIDNVACVEICKVYMFDGGCLKLRMKSGSWTLQNFRIGDPFAIQ